MFIVHEHYYLMNTLIGEGYHKKTLNSWRGCFIVVYLCMDINNVIMEREIIKYLWKILDDIDTMGDIAKFNDKFYRQKVERLQKKRWNTGITTDGYELDFSNMKLIE